MSSAFMWSCSVSAFDIWRAIFVYTFMFIFDYLGLGILIVLYLYLLHYRKLVLRTCALLKE